jgi:hypothetical protein
MAWLWTALAVVMTPILVACVVVAAIGMVSVVEEAWRRSSLRRN